MIEHGHIFLIIKEVMDLFCDWQLYENGWHVEYPDGGYKNKHLFYYLQQMGNWGRYRPEELDYFN